MPIVGEVKGDLLQAEEKFIAQQCNCVTVKSQGLAAVITKKYPWAEPYSTRKAIPGRNCATEDNRDVPGTVRILSNYDVVDVDDASSHTAQSNPPQSTTSQSNPPQSTAPSGNISQSTPPQVVCMFAQWAPGKPGHFDRYYPSSHNDTALNRLQWFCQCLREIDENKDIDGLPIAFPYNIGCGLAGGNWSLYREALDHAKTEIVLYKQ